MHFTYRLLSYNVECRHVVGLRQAVKPGFQIELLFFFGLGLGLGLGIQIAGNLVIINKSGFN